MSFEQNKEIVKKMQDALKSLGYDVPRGHVYEIFSKMSGFKFYNAAKAKNVDFSKLLNKMQNDVPRSYELLSRMSESKFYNPQTSIKKEPCLYDAYTKKPISPSKVEKNEYIQNAFKKWDVSVKEKIIVTIDSAIDEVCAKGQGFKDDLTGGGGLSTFMNAGILVGRSSTFEYSKITHLWDSINSLVGYNSDPVAEKITRITVGALIKWRVSVRSEKYWFVAYDPSGRKDAVTGVEIFVAKYWINIKFVPPVNKKATLQDLANKFNPVKE